jgi:hypothetical protein
VIPVRPPFGDMEAEIDLGWRGNKDPTCGRHFSLLPDWSFLSSATFSEGSGLKASA